MELSIGHIPRASDRNKNILRIIPEPFQPQLNILFQEKPKSRIQRQQPQFPFVVLQKGATQRGSDVIILEFSQHSAPEWNAEVDLIATPSSKDWIIPFTVSPQYNQLNTLPFKSREINQTAWLP